MRQITPTDPRERIRELEQALKHQLALTDAERRRADALEQSMKTAWLVAMGGPRAPDRLKQTD